MVNFFFLSTILITFDQEKEIKLKKKNKNKIFTKRNTPPYIDILILFYAIHLVG